MTFPQTGPRTPAQYEAFFIPVGCEQGNYYANVRLENELIQTIGLRRVDSAS
jgi:hypothetical protein